MTPEAVLVNEERMNDATLRILGLMQSMAIEGTTHDELVAAVSAVNIITVGDSSQDQDIVAQLMTDVACQVVANVEDRTVSTIARPSMAS